ncbi:hypothetical protein M5E87_14245 [Flavonifractor plautii]|nr:hypothetical protein M5E87_14245 [Flavonifractor plautii]
MCWARWACPATSWPTPCLWPTGWAPTGWRPSTWPSRSSASSTGWG